MGNMNTREDHTSVPPADGRIKKRTTVHFTARDLVNVAIFAAIYIVITFLIAMFGILGPWAVFITMPLSALICGIPYMLFLTRVHQFGLVTLFAVIVALFFFIYGHTWMSTILTISLGLVADIIMSAGKYRSKWAAIFACTMFSGWLIGPFLPMIVSRDEFLQSPAMRSMGQEYVDGFSNLFNTLNLLGLFVLIVLCGFFGALFGASVLRKHFTRAGLA